MGNGSPTAFLLWAILSCIYLVFLLMHLWNYDRFQCLRWDSGRQPGAFKRVMTYSYLATVPLLVIFSVAMTVIKFKEGFIVAPGGTIMPRPFILWDSSNRNWILPLYFVISIAWSLEQRQVTRQVAKSFQRVILHVPITELTFWVFLLNQGPGKREWFASWEFRVWTIGSVATLTGMPMTVLATRHNIETCLAYIFLVGAAAGTTTTVCFFYVLARFPWFIRHVKSEGAEPDVVVRLATFYQLNRIRVLFRYLFTLPLLIIALDGLMGPYPIVGDPFALDFLLMMGGIGCFISSAITLLIFFPRSITRESGYQTKAHSPQNTKTLLQGFHPPASAGAYHTSSSTTRRSHSPKSAMGYAQEVRMGAFRFPEAMEGERGERGEGDGDGYSFELVRSGSSGSSGRPRLGWDGEREGREGRRGRGEESASASELEPGYVSDAESLSEGVVRQGQTLSSEDTVWERGGQGRGQGHTYPWGVTGGKRRRHSDGPFFFDARGQLVSPGARPVVVGIGIGMEARSGSGRRRGREEERAVLAPRTAAVMVEESALHPYVRVVSFFPSGWG
ncbi:hypothetical protein FPV67DRAFT_1785750 [Lyophyllum atratum]|nr:hypothetical protein FPV67DRAFT_1785750 [Lyophyllum atratum]